MEPFIIFFMCNVITCLGTFITLVVYFLPYGEKMEEALSVDEQGRVVLPAYIRKAMGIRGRCKLLIRREGSKIVLEPFPENLSRSVEEWANLARTTRAEIFSETVEDSWKWMSLEYARRKLSLP